MIFRICTFIHLIIAISYGTGQTRVLRPISDTFVVKPGPGNILHRGAADYNYGGAGSRAVASPEAYAYEVYNGYVTINDKPKGEYISLLKFNFTDMAGKKINSVKLKLYISNGNGQAQSLFNRRGTSGDFDLSWCINDWEQGTGSPHEIVSYPYNSLNGVNYNSLQVLLEEFPAGWLERFNYPATNPYGSPFWYEYIFDVKKATYINLLQAIAQGRVISFMLSPAPESHVSFNFAAYVQQWNDEIYYREDGPILEIEYEEYEPLISNCYSVASVQGHTRVGQLSGQNSGRLSECYASGSVTGDFGDPNACIGPLTGYSVGDESSCFWNIETSALPHEISAHIPAGLTEEEMCQSELYSGWDFQTGSGWKMIRPGEDYPRLTWQREYPGDLAGRYGVDMADLIFLAENWLADGASDSEILDMNDFAAIAADWLKNL